MGASQKRKALPKQGQMVAADCTLSVLCRKLYYKDLCSRFLHGESFVSNNECNLIIVRPHRAALGNSVERCFKVVVDVAPRGQQLGCLRPLYVMDSQRHDQT